MRVLRRVDLEVVDESQVDSQVYEYEILSGMKAIFERKWKCILRCRLRRKEVINYSVY